MEENGSWTHIDKGMSKKGHRYGTCHVIHYSGAEITSTIQNARLHIIYENAYIHRTQNTEQHNTTQHNTTQYNALPYSTVQHNANAMQNYKKNPMQGNKLKDNTFIYIHKHTHIYRQTDRHIHTYVHAYIMTCMHTYIHSTYTYIHTYVRTRVYTDTHHITYIHTHTHTASIKCSGLWTYDSLGRAFHESQYLQFLCRVLFLQGTWNVGARLIQGGSPLTSVTACHLITETCTTR